MPMSSFTSLRSTRGFAPLTQLVVILIIAILATGVFSIFQSVKQKFRDSQRIADLESIVKALRQYNIENDHYPYNGDPAMGTWSAENFKAVLSQYVRPWPNDPSADVTNRAGVGGYKYVYCVAPTYDVAGQTYVLAVHLERRDVMYLAGDNTEISNTQALVDVVSTAEAPADCMGDGVDSLVVSQ